MNNCIKTQVCRLCNSNKIKDFISLGLTAPANSYCTTQKEALTQEKFPLKVFLCDSCYSVQLRHSVNPSLLFKNYKYASSTVISLTKHFKNYTESLISQGFYGKVLEIGSNDGVLLDHLRNARFQILGVEPSENLAKIANERGLNTICGFFNEELAKKILEKFGKFNLVVANNVFGHAPDLHSIVKGISLILEKDGVFVFENSYLLDVINTLNFSVLYHEHFYTHSLTPLKNFLESYGLQIFDVVTNNAQGGSFRVFVQRKEGVRTIEPIVNQMLLTEDQFYKSGKLGEFADNVNQLSLKIKRKIKQIKEEGKTISLYGVAAKLTTFCAKFGLNHKNCEYAIDESPLKIGLYTPNGIKIVGKNHFVKAPTDYCIITAFNYAKLIKTNNPGYKGEWINLSELN